MIAARSFPGKTVAVFGLARTGLASVRALKAGGARVIAFEPSPRAFRLLARTVEGKCEARQIAIADRSTNLAVYASVPISFSVASVIDLDRLRVGAPRQKLHEVPLAHAYTKDYDALP